MSFSSVGESLYWSIQGVAQNNQIVIYKESQSGKKKVAFSMKSFAKKKKVDHRSLSADFSVLFQVTELSAFKNKTEFRLTPCHSMAHFFLFACCLPPLLKADVFSGNLAVFQLLGEKVCHRRRATDIEQSFFGNLISYLLLCYSSFCQK